MRCRGQGANLILYCSFIAHSKKCSTFLDSETIRPEPASPGKFLTVAQPHSKSSNHQDQNYRYDPFDPFSCQFIQQGPKPMDRYSEEHEQTLTCDNPPRSQLPLSARRSLMAPPSSSGACARPSIVDAAALNRTAER